MYSQSWPGCALLPVWLFLLSERIFCYGQFRKRVPVSGLSDRHPAQGYAGKNQEVLLMRNISKKTRKKINKILLSNHFKKKLGVTQDTLVYTPNPESPLSAIWHHIEIRYDGTIFGYLLDDKVKYAVIGSVNRRKARQTIRSPEQFFHPRCHFARQSKQIAFRLKKMGEDKLARIFDDDAALLLIINMWNLEIEDDDFSFVTQDMISPILEGKTND